MSCLVLYYEHKVITMELLELCCLKVEEDSISPILRVQAPLYRQGPGYMFGSDCPAVGFIMAVTLAQFPLSPAPLPGAGRFYKVLLSPRPSYPQHMPQLPLDIRGSFMGGRWRWPCGWRHLGLRC
jgi:hypothetical protein